MRNVSEKEENMKLNSVNSRTYKTDCVKDTYAYAQIFMKFFTSFSN